MARLERRAASDMDDCTDSSTMSSRLLSVVTIHDTFEILIAKYICLSDIVGYKLDFNLSEWRPVLCNTSYGNAFCALGSLAQPEMPISCFAKGRVDHGPAGPYE
jgi:hypothetical protein